MDNSQMRVKEIPLLVVAVMVAGGGNDGADMSSAVIS